MPGTIEPGAVTVALDDPDQPDIAAMLAESDAWYAAHYPAESNHLVDMASLKQPAAAFFTARAGGRIRGFGSLLRRTDMPGETYGEIKRMYVAPESRGLGLGRLILETLEHHAAGFGLACIRLETGVRQPEAIGLYRACGYVETGPFGDYRADPLSVFMAKRLGCATA